MKALVVGGGSIGTRHLRNLKKLGADSLALVETDASRREAIARELPVAGFTSLDQALTWGPDFAIVATPTHLHTEQALQIAHAGCPLFVEKPLSHTPTRLGELVAAITERRITSLVGCNMRFHPGPAKVKQLLDGGRLGKILFARIQAGSYLPNWRPNSDYRQNYAARVDTGGGCILDCIHEIDLARWYLGEVESVFCHAGHLSSLEIETEDVAILICWHSSGAFSEIHLDYVQRTYERGCQIVGELGSMFWDFSSGVVRWYCADSDQWTSYRQPDNWEINQMYIDEMRHFLSCVTENRPPALPIPEAVALMQVVFAAKASAEQGRTMAIEGEARA